MSQIVPTEYGRLRRVTKGGADAWLLEVPGCGKLELLDDRQMAGELSVNHAAVCICGYHETHPFGPALVVAIQARALTGGPLYEEDTPMPEPRP